MLPQARRARDYWGLLLFRLAYSAAWVRLARWSLSRMLRTCVATVRTLMLRLAAISRFDCP